MLSDNVIRARIALLLFNLRVVARDPQTDYPAHITIDSLDGHGRANLTWGDDDMSEERIGDVLAVMGRNYLTLPWLGAVVKAARRKGFGVTINGNGPVASVWVGSIDPICSSGNLAIAPRDNLIPKTLCEMILVWARLDEHPTSVSPTEGTIETSTNRGG